MKIYINGNVFHDNATIINGRVVNSTSFVKSQKFDERKTEDCSNIEKITINSPVISVNVFAFNTSKVEAHFYGEANIDGDINFDAQVVNRELRITLKVTGNCFNSNLQLDVIVPHKTFKVISAKSISADITLDEDVSADYLNVKTQSGNLKTDATVNNVSVSTVSGNVKLCMDAAQNIRAEVSTVSGNAKLCINAAQDINVKVSTVSGDVTTKFNNISRLNLSTSTISGKVKNQRNEIQNPDGYNANVTISTISGDIKIK